MQDILTYFSFGECSLPTFKSVVCFICKVYIWYDVLLLWFFSCLWSVLSVVSYTLRYRPTWIINIHSVIHSYSFSGNGRRRRDGNQVCVLVRTGAGCLDEKQKENSVTVCQNENDNLSFINLSYNWNHLFFGSLEVAETRCDHQHWHI